MQRPGELTKVEDQFRRASAALQRGDLVEAERLYKKVLHARPNHLGALNLLGILLTQMGRDNEAERVIRSALRINAKSQAAQYNHGLVLKKLNRLSEALAAFENALVLSPNAENWNSRGTVLNALERFEEALSDFDKAIELKPDFADAFYNRANTLQKLMRYEAAIESYDKAIRLNPHYAPAYNNRATALLKLWRLEDALTDFDRAIALRPDIAENHVGRGDALAHLKRLEDALAAFDRALAINPEGADAWRGRGDVFSAANRFDDAFAAYDKAVAIKPDFVEAWERRGQAAFLLGRHQDLLLAYQKALETKPDLGNAVTFVSKMVYSKMMLCDWHDLEDQCTQIVAGIRAGEVVDPFLLLSLPCSADDQLACARAIVTARATVGEEVQTRYEPVTRRQRASHRRIRIGFLSFDLRDHAVSRLTVGMLERHDRMRFETFAISLGPDDGSPMRKRMEAAFDQFHDVERRSDQDIAALMRELQIDIAVDLGGFTTGARMHVLACRPAPIQVNYLGYPGTIGADYIDYIIADRLIIPPDQQQFYSEKVVYLPDTYQPNANKQVISDLALSCAEAGLPAHGFIFCSFNNAFKLNPSIFDVWMRLLREIEGSVLWLPEANAAVPTNLRREAESRGVSADRLIFAPRMTKLEDHLARYRLADLFLDTLPYNAHTTASDALWAGLPVLTCLGATFAGRVAGSLLSAIGLPQLITHSLEEYEHLALRLARNPDVLASLKAQLAGSRLTAPLFNTTQFTLHIEKAYVTMWERYQRGQQPAGFAVDP